MFWELLTLISQCEGEKLLDLKTIVKETNWGAMVFSLVKFVLKKWFISV